MVSRSRILTFHLRPYRVADWLTSCYVATAAMESIGTYWIPVFEVLESRGLEVKLVNARHMKNILGRKTDVFDCQWRSCS